MATTNYTIDKTFPTIYLDSRNNAVQGFVVVIHLIDYDEMHELRVPSLAPNVVKKAADELAANRDALANLGNPSKK